MTRICSVAAVQPTGRSLAWLAMNGGRPTGRHAVMLALALLLAVTPMSSSLAGDLNVVPLLDGERSDSLNLWGGPLGIGSVNSFSKQSTVVHSGLGAYEADLGAVGSGGFEFFQTFSSAVDYTPGYRQDRNLTRYDSLQGYVRNDTGNPITFTLELKDYRDSLSHVAKRSFTIPAGSTWQQFVAPLDLSAGWNVTGTPDLARTFAVSFLVDADYGALNGSLYLDDISLREKGPAIDPATAPINTIVERLAERQFDALWSARNKTTGIIPNTSDNVRVGALNTTTGVVWNLPSAVRRGWVTQAEADTYMGQLVTSLNTNRDQTNYLPTRFLNLVTAAPEGDEESSIDASFLTLALHNYKSQASTPTALRNAIDNLENRFDFSAFTTSGAYSMAYLPASGSFCDCAYSGYTNENNVIALAAAVSDDHYVPLANEWNKDVDRTLASLTDPSQNYLVLSGTTDHRAPFVQALINLFVDLSDRGADSYPNRALARNEWENYVRYEADVMARLGQLGRENFVQPDAARGAGTYHAWSLYNDHGEPDLFQPWSVALALLAGAPGTEDALRFLLENGLGGGLDGPLGLADSAQWVTGAADPTDVPSLADNWNMTLSLMAMMRYLDGDDSAARFFADLPEVAAELDTVFVAGDYDGNGTVDAGDYAFWKATFGSTTLLAADGNNNGVIDAGDYTVWRDHSLGGGRLLLAVPEPASAAMLCQVAVAALLMGRFTRFTKRKGQTTGGNLEGGGRRLNAPQTALLGNSGRSL